MSIHKSTSKKSPWRVLYRDADGRQRSRSFATHKEAAAFDATVKSTAPEDRVAPTRTPTLLDEINQADGSMLLRDWFTEWFANYGRLWGARTLDDRSHICAKWITPFIGDVPIDQISARLIKRFRTKIADAGASNNRVNAVTTVLSAALEVEAIRYAMPTPRDKIIVSLIAYAGLRPAEVCGLTWAHIRDDVILVEQSIQKRAIGPTKTKRTRRHSPTNSVPRATSKKLVKK